VKEIPGSTLSGHLTVAYENETPDGHYQTLPMPLDSVHLYASSGTLQSSNRDFIGCCTCGGHEACSVAAAGRRNSALRDKLGEGRQPDTDIVCGPIHSITSGVRCFAYQSEAEF